MGWPDITTLRSDTEERPKAFCWYGAIPPEALRQWLERRTLQVPGDLEDLWRWRGGGVIFESEEILAPLGGDEHALDWDEVNQAHHRSGLPEALSVFHEGTWVSAVRAEAPCYIALERDTYATAGEFECLDEWYCATIRKEFAERYDLRATGAKAAT